MGGQIILERIDQAEPTPSVWIKIGDQYYLNNVQKSVVAMGTDSQQARVLTERQVYLPPELGLNPIQYLNEKGNAAFPLTTH